MLSEEAMVSVPTSKIHPDPDNVNLHSEANIAHIVASIEKFGFIDPLGVVEHPDKKGHFMVVEGHGRLDAAKELKLKSLPVVMLSLNDVERRSYAVAHNQIQRINGMNLDAVADEFKRLGVDESDFMSLGFTEEDALFLPQKDDLLHTPGSGGDTPEDETPAEQGTQAPFIPPVHKTTLRFASDVGLNRFVLLLSLLRGSYLTAETHAERLMALMRDRDLVTADGDA